SARTAIPPCPFHQQRRTRQMFDHLTQTRPTMKVSIALGAAVLVILGCAGSPHANVAHNANPGSASAPASTPKQDDSSSETLGLKLGQTITMTDSDGNSIDVTVNSATWKTKACSAYASNPGPGKAFLVIEVTAKATKGDFDINPFDFNAVDSNG